MGRFLIIGALFIAQATSLAASSRRDEDVTFRSGDVTIACTLSLPAASGRVATVVLLSGSGPQNRDSELVGFRPFKMIADFFVARSIAVLRCDDRGVGGSSGSLAASTLRDFADDALAAIRMLHGREEIDPARIGLAGHSEGAIVAAIAASRSTDVKFVVWLAGSAVPGAEIMSQQAAAVARAGGATETSVQEIQQLHSRFLAAIASDAPDSEVVKLGRALATVQMTAVPESKRPTPAQIEAVSDRLVNQSLSLLRSPWMRFFIGFDPWEALGRVTCPVFAAFGGRDLQVPAAPNRSRLNAALTSAGNQDVTVRQYPDANHLFQPAITGDLSEYATLPKEFVGPLLNDLATWISAR